MFYNELAGLGNGKVTLLEAPWHYNDNILAYYEWVHRQHVYVGFVAGLEGTFRTGEVPAGDSRFRFRNFMHVSDFRRIEEKGIDYVVFHRNLEEERPSGISVFVADVSGWIDVYMKRYGNPVYEDRFLTVFRVSPQQDR